MSVIRLFSLGRRSTDELRGYSTQVRVGRCPHGLTLSLRTTAVLNRRAGREAEQLRQYAKLPALRNDLMVMVMVVIVFDLASIGRSVDCQ